MTVVSKFFMEKLVPFQLRSHKPSNCRIEVYGTLRARFMPAQDGEYLTEPYWIDLGVISRRLVTDAFVNELVDQLQASTGQIANFSWHASGIGITAESAGDTALGSEVATRSDGSQVEGATANIYKTVGTINYSGNFAITEHGVFNASSAGILMDRSVFGAINVTPGSSIEFDFELTAQSGG